MYKRIVVKVGTKVLSKKDGSIDTKIVRHVVEQISALKKKGIQVILVTSGAVGTGRALLSAKDSGYVPQKQMFAAVGQVKLMSMYAELFVKRGYLCAQVLATKEDFRDREHYVNMKNCFEKLLHESVVPIVNENDVVAIAELVFTDNDELVGLVAAQLHVDAVIILTGVDGVLADGRTVALVNSKNAAGVRKYITAEKSTGGRGGMHTKFNVALKLAKRGITTYIVNGKKRNVLVDVVAGKRLGTKFFPRSKAIQRKR
ncbi:MAG: glutamate 5-kinase [bacterium]|nr:glutamate 5-kinase [bacterium]